MKPAQLMSLFDQCPAKLARAHERKVQMQLVDGVHNRQVRRAGRLWQGSKRNHD
ncbi:hypothetical protein [Ferrovum myxofaciens]|uniref:Uncharacterized protein n=1 Tax=Ferrovum myxofaciens TaxID=416213 RepID=A0A149VW03_9PROT|nr:hypothetical protein [Ferrovum myxofaciens]KXW57405.1 hypothetical protein FEMY_20750 [Ferrovum myxofaciens]